jgi:hypothetical protein
MTSRAFQLLLFIAAIGFWPTEPAPARAEGGDPAALAAAMKDTSATLQGGLKASETAVKANPGSQAVSIYPQLQNVRAVAEVTLLQGKVLKKVTEKLD